MLIIFTLQLIQSTRILWFCHRSQSAHQKDARSLSGGQSLVMSLHGPDANRSFKGYGHTGKDKIQNKDTKQNESKLIYDEF
jgi:hypothetical protein